MEGFATDFDISVAKMFRTTNKVIKI